MFEDISAGYKTYHLKTKACHILLKYLSQIFALAANLFPFLFKLCKAISAEKSIDSFAVHVKRIDSV